VIGVHTPEFSFEHEIDRVRHATTERAIDYPVVVDNDYEIWGAFDNHYWPALHFVDADSKLRDHHFGEGRYAQSERLIQRLLGVERELVSVEGLGVEAEADWDHLRSPETYLGYGRGEHFASPGGLATPASDLLDYVAAVFGGEDLWNTDPGKSAATEMPANHSSGSTH